MFARALIVLLLVLNAGVAIWWIAREPPPPSMLVQPSGAAPLRLVSEAPGRIPAAPAGPPPIASPATSAPVAAAAAQCFSFGPYPDATTAATARTRLQSMAVRMATREQLASPARGWRVQLPPQPTPEAAQAMAQRIEAAGFSDFLIVRDGPEANAIALGRYRGEASARRRAAALVAAGFAVRAEPLGEAHATTWIDLLAVPGFDAAAARAAAATQMHAIDCAPLR